MAFSETRSLLRSDVANAKPLDNVSSSSDDWSSSYSSGSPESKHSSEDSYSVEWESHVTKNGSLFYLEFNTQPVQALQGQQNISDKGQSLLALRNDFKRTSTRRSKKSGGRLSNLINGNHKVHKDAMKKKTSANRSAPMTRNYLSIDKDTTNKVKFNEMVEGEVKEIAVFIDPAMRHKYGRRTSIAEALLGVSLCPFPDSARIMIAGYMPNSEISQDKAIKIGDWLKTINDQDINIENVDTVLLSFVQPTYIKLQLKRIAMEEHPMQHQPNIGKSTNTGEFVDTLKSLFPSIDVEDQERSSTFSVLFLSMKESDERNGDDVIFSHPRKEINCLYGIRGTFLTLNSLFRECTFNSKPKTTSIYLQNVEYFVSYYSCNDELLLTAIPAKYTTFQEAKLKLNEIVRCLEFMTQHLPQVFSSKLNVDNEIVEEQQQNDNYINFNLIDIFSTVKLAYLDALPTQARFEDALEQPHYIPLPKEAQLRIDDALSEMEAMDYREWNDEPLKSHREFYMLGSALYFRRFLLASHLPASDLLDVEAFLRINGIYLMIDSKPVRELIVWCEIYPKSVDRGLIDAHSNKPNRFSSRRWFLAIVARNHLFMTVILESRHITESEEAASSTIDHIGPSKFYIEEIQDTLDHLQTGGVENLANTWLNANKRPETLQCFAPGNVTPLSNASTIGAGATHINPNPNAATSLLTNTVEALTMGLKTTEVTSILKRRNNSSENVNENLKYHNIVAVANSGGSPSVNSQTLSDSSLQKYEDDDDESDSDWDGFPESQRSSSGFDISDMTSTFFREISDVLSSKITAGKENVLFHYVQIEMGEGMLMAPPCTQSTNVVKCIFRKACLFIHNTLQNTIRFRHLLAQETTSPNSHRSLVAIKEHGILISTENNSDQQIEFWIIGRLFSTPCKELYVCHRSDVPQNVVEMAFRLGLHSAG